MTIADKLTLLASSKEALRVKLGLPESLPFSEYYKYVITNPDTNPDDAILALFAGGKQGVWYDPSDKSTLFQDAAGTVPVTKDGDPVALMKDKSGNGNHATQTVSASRPVYKTDGDLHWISFDGIDDSLITTKRLWSFVNFSSLVAVNTLGLTSTGAIFDLNIENIGFVLFSPASSGTHSYSFRSSSSASGIGSFVHTSEYALPAKRLVRTLVDSNAISLYINGGLANSIVGMMPTNGDGVLTIANSRLNTPFKGDVYSMIIADSMVEFGVAEAYVANKSGVTL